MLLNLFKQKNKITIWFFMLPFAMLSGFMGALDPGSNNNVFIPMGAWFILTGVLSAAAFMSEYPVIDKWALHLAALGFSFVLLFYKPVSVLVSPQADEVYQDFVSYLNALDGPVYAPWLGQLESGYTFAPPVHWVPMEDLVRGPGVDTYNHPNTRMLLDSVIHPTGDAYILMNYPLENDPLLSFLLEDGYTLEVDLGGRFSALTTLPKRYNLEYPRYLYKYQH
jgi:energy-converting hydrogenase Eha subunit E